MFVRLRVCSNQLGKRRNGDFTHLLSIIYLHHGQVLSVPQNAENENNETFNKLVNN